MYSKAHNFLVQSDSTDITVEEMVTAIQKQAMIDDTKVIDHVDGVQTVEAFEYVFTCRDFLIHIE